MSGIASSGQRFNVVAMDGGGIYGLVTAIWLRQLCEKDPTFLNGDESQGEIVFAGASSGAVNALLLARHEKPREALLSGEIEAFWKKPGVFSNENPVTSWLSLCGVGAWFNTEELQNVLRDTFGDLKIADLKQHVVLSTFNWVGNEITPDLFPAGMPGGWLRGYGFDLGESMQWVTGGGARKPPQPPPKAPGGRAQTDQSTGWRPEIFANFPVDKVTGRSQRRAAQLAYEVAAAAGYRAVFNGIGDAAIYSANPSIQAISTLVHHMRWPTGMVEVDKPANTTDFSIGGVLSNISMLSVGDGSVTPSYWLKNFDLSFSQFNVVPTNPLTGQWFSPVYLTPLEGPTQAADYSARELLGSDRYCRLDPGIMPLPTLIATTMARFPPYRTLIQDQIYEAVRTDPSKAAVTEAASFVKDWRWPGAPAPLSF